MNTPINNFLKEMGRLEIKKEKSLFKSFRYLTLNNCKEPYDYKSSLDYLFDEFKTHIFSLPERISTKKGRRTYSSSLCHDLILKLEQQENQFRTEINIDYKYIYSGPVIEKSFPFFSKQYYPDKQDWKHHKIHFMYSLQNIVLKNSIELLMVYSINDGYNIYRKYKKLLSPELASQIQIKVNQCKCLRSKTMDFDIQWTGKNMTEFVQLIYSLYEANLIECKGGKARLVETLAEVFGVKLSKFWESSHSKSIHARNVDYEVELFSKIKKAYHRYREDKLEK